MLILLLVCGLSKVEFASIFICSVLIFLLWMCERLANMFAFARISVNHKIQLVSVAKIIAIAFAF